MIVDVSTRLRAPPERVWEEVQKPALLRRVAAPLITFISREPGGFPKRWSPGPHRVWMFALGFIPLGPQTVGLELGPHEPGLWRVRDRGHGLLARVWDHQIEIRPDGTGQTLYRDQVRVEAGLLTPLVWVFGTIFYRWRQHNWRRIAPRLVATEAARRIA